MDDILELVGGPSGGVIRLDGVTLVAVDGFEVEFEDGEATIRLKPGQKLTMATPRPEPRDRA